MNPASRARAHPSRRRRGGSVLIVVLVVCLGLASLVLMLGHSMLMAYRGSDNEIAGRQAEAVTLGAVQYAETLMTGVAAPGDVPDPTTYQSAAVPVGDGAFWFIGLPPTGDTSDQPAFGLVDEAGKLNLNTATVEMLEKLPGMTADLAQAIVDWHTSADANQTAATGGLTITTGTVKQAAFESVEEIGLVIGGTDPTLIYGDDTNLNHVLDPEETSTQSGVGQGQFYAGLMEYCTVFSRESNLLSDGTKRKDVTKLNEVQSALRSVLGQGSAQTLIDTARRRLEAEGLSRSNATPQQPGRRGTPDTAWDVKSVLEFYAASGISADDFAKVAPYLTTGGSNFKEGLINVNTASTTVLACVPGLSDELATQLVAARAQQSAATAADWSWVVSVIGARTCHYAGPSLTTRSYQWSADVAAVGRYGRGYRRTRFVIDSSTGTPMVVYRRDLAALGWALGGDARRDLQDQLQLTQGGGRR